VLIGLGLSIGTIAIDRAFDYGAVPESLTGGPDAALQILSTIAASMVSLTALVLTITMVVVQLAMGQFSPRIVQTILRDKPSQIAIGLFVATFAHSVVAMREVDPSGQGQVPGLAILVAYLLVLASIVVLVIYVHHIGQALRVSALIELVGSDTRDLLHRLYPEHLVAPRPDNAQAITAPHSGVITRIRTDDLVRAAREANCTLELTAALGEFVPAGAQLVGVSGDGQRLDADAVLDGIELGLERTLEQDAAYGMRMLVDIAERSLSESPFQDPTTAVQAIDRLHDCLRQISTRELSDGRFYDEDGVVRLITPVMDWEAYVHLAFDEVRLAGAGSPQIARRLTAALTDLIALAPQSRRAPLQEQLDLLGQLTVEAMPDERDATIALQPDPRGIGVRTVG
jgi:uncharacterized membrane protein